MLDDRSKWGHENRRIQKDSVTPSAVFTNLDNSKRAEDMHRESFVQIMQAPRFWVVGIKRTCMGCYNYPYTLIISAINYNQYFDSFHAWLGYSMQELRPWIKILCWVLKCTQGYELNEIKIYNGLLRSIENNNIIDNVDQYSMNFRSYNRLCTFDARDSKYISK